MRRVYKNLCPATISASIMAANMWKNSLKSVESDRNKILYEILLDCFFYSETVLTFWISLVFHIRSCYTFWDPSCVFSVPNNTGTRLYASSCTFKLVRCASLCVARSYTVKKLPCKSEYKFMGMNLTVSWRGKPQNKLRSCSLTQIYKKKRKKNGLLCFKTSDLETAST